MIPDDVRRFVLTSVPSIPHLEAALLFLDEPGTRRSPEQIARALYIPEQVVLPILAYLVTIGCLTAPDDTGPGYRYVPRDTAMDSLLKRLAAAYRSDMIAVTHLIHDTTQKNAHRFADAFKLKKER